jgi:hypothetical protein
VWDETAVEFVSVVRMAGKTERVRVWPVLMTIRFLIETP